MTGIWASMSGRLFRDAKHRQTKAGKPMTTFQLLVPINEKGATQLVGCIAFKDIAETGRAWRQNEVVSVEGFLTLTTWDGSDGKPRSGLNLLAVKGHAGWRKDKPANDAASPADRERGAA